MGHRPPVLARWLVRLVCPVRATGLLGDLTEEYHRRASGGDPKGARRAFRRDAVASVLPLLLLRARRSSCTAPGVLAGVAAVALWFVVVYAALTALTQPGQAPLGDLPEIAFFAVWVFGGALVGALVAGRVGRQPGSPGGVAVGLFVSAVVILGVDAPLALGQELVVLSVALSGSAAGSLLSNTRVRPAATTTP